MTYINTTVKVNSAIVAKSLKPIDDLLFLTVKIYGMFKSDEVHEASIKINIPADQAIDYLKTLQLPDSKIEIMEPIEDI